MKVGYAYSSEIEQALDQQVKRLQELGCERIYQEKLSGVRAERLKLKKCINSLRAGDTLIVCRLERLGNKVEKVLLMLNELVNMNVTFISLDDNFNTNGLTGQVLAHITQALMTLKNDVFKARVSEGRKEAERKGVKFGRKEGSVNKRNKNKPQQCRQLYDNGLPVSRIMALLNIRSYSTVYRYLRQTGVYPTTKGAEKKPSTKLSKKELLKFKKEVYDSSHQLDLF
ncbi:MAG: recombinase family protein [Bacteroidaceae bacterium]|nr:recombinase family protein [Bacteroidaceae bacterium]